MNPLNFPIQQQICTEWCWASVAEAVCACYSDPDAPDQRGIVSLVNEDASGDCGCDQNSGLPCNEPKDLSFVLAKIRHRGAQLGRPEFIEITDEIDQGQPIVVQVELPESAAAGHAIAIYGYTDQGSVLIADPMHAGDKITVVFEDLLNGTSSTFHATWRAAFKTIPR
jgi:hypothetical protein